MSLFARFPIRNHVLDILREQTKANYVKYIIYLAIFFLAICITLSGVFFVMNKDKTQRASAQALANVYGTCEDEFDINESFHKMGIKNAAYGTLFFGAEIGFLLQVKYF